MTAHRCMMSVHTSLTALLTAMAIPLAPAWATPSDYSCRNVNSLTRRHSSTSETNLISAMAMGMQCVSPSGYTPPSDLSGMLSACQEKSKRFWDSDTPSIWFGKCHPLSLIWKVVDIEQPDQEWTFFSYGLDTGTKPRTDALNAIARAIMNPFYMTPVIIPIYGRANHWITIYTAKIENSPSGIDIKQINFHDPLDITDGDGGMCYNPDTMTVKPCTGFGPSATLTGADLSDNTYFRTLQILGPSCPCADDETGHIVGMPGNPAYDLVGKYIGLYDPPRLSPLAADPAVPLRWWRAPGVVSSGLSMSEEGAARNVGNALAMAGFASDPAVQERLRTGVIGAAYYIEALFPEGPARRHFIVPILDATAQHATMFVKMDALDGAVQATYKLDPGFTYRPISAQQARQIASQQLRPGEELSEPVQRWDARLNHPAARHPFQSFYEFPIASAGQRGSGEVARVARNGGAWLGRFPAAESSTP